MIMIMKNNPSASWWT